MVGSGAFLAILVWSRVTWTLEKKQQRGEVVNMTRGMVTVGILIQEKWTRHTCVAPWCLSAMNHIWYNWNTAMKINQLYSSPSTETSCRKRVFLPFGF